MLRQTGLSYKFLWVHIIDLFNSLVAKVWGIFSVVVSLQFAGLAAPPSILKRCGGGVLPAGGRSKAAKRDPGAQEPPGPQEPPERVKSTKF